MPPKAEMSKELIIQTAFDFVRENGMDGLTARSLAKSLNCSTQPIYSLYGNMEGIKNQIFQMAIDYEREYILGYKNEEHSVALNLAIGFLHFAKQEKQLFKTIYLSGHKSYDLSIEEFLGEALSIGSMRNSKRMHDMSENQLKKMFLNLSLYLIGIATMIHSNTLKLNIDEAEGMIKDMYEALLLHEGRAER